MQMKNHNPSPTTAKAETTNAKINWLPIVTGVLVFAIITFLYFSPMLIDGKAIQQGDIMQGKGAAKELNDFRAANNKEALWTNSMFGGMPGYQIATLYYGNCVRYINSVLSLGFPHPSQLLFIAMVSFFILLLTMGISPWISIAGAIAFGLSSYNLGLIEAGHNSKIGAIGYMPLVIAGVLMVFRKRNYLLGGALTALAVSLEVKSNHIQIAYYLFFILIALGLTEFVFTVLKKDWKHFITACGVLLIAAVLGVASNLSLLWTTEEYAAETIRGKSELSSNTQSAGGLDKDYALQWSYGKMESFTMLIPGFMGGSSNEELSENSATGKALQAQGASGQQLADYLKQMPLYWGDKPFTSSTVYLGAIVMFLFVLGMLLVNDRLKWWLFSISCLGTLLAWGHNLEWFSDLFFYYVPGYNKFRVVEMCMIIPQVCIPILAFVTLDTIMRRKMETDLMIKKIFLALYITGGVLVCVILGSMFFDFKAAGDTRYPDWLVKSLMIDRASFLQMDAVRSLSFILLAWGTICAYVKGIKSKFIIAISVFIVSCLIMFYGNIMIEILFVLVLFVSGIIFFKFPGFTVTIKKGTLLIIIIILVFIDLFPVGKRYLNDDNFVSKSDYENYFQPTQTDQQILQDQSLDYRVFNTASNTFNDSRTSYYHKSAGGYHAAKLRRYQELIENHLSKQNTAVIDMLNTRYYIFSVGKDKAPQAQRNPGALGNAWFVDSVMVVADADEELNRIGKMYEVQTLDGSSFTVNGKETKSALIGNHDNIKIGEADFDASQFGLNAGMADTFGISSRLNKETGEQEKYVSQSDAVSTNKKFTARYNYNFNPRRYVVVDKRFDTQLKGFSSVGVDSARNIKLISYQPNNLKYKCSNSKEGVLVFSEIYYNKGWNGYVDGKPADYFRCNYVLRGMKIPAGNHDIEWKFEPASYYTGEKVAFASSLLILILFFGAVGMEVMKMRKQQ